MCKAGEPMKVNRLDYVKKNNNIFAPPAQDDFDQEDPEPHDVPPCARVITHAENRKEADAKEVRVHVLVLFDFFHFGT